jgi:hypothetical protein
MKTLILIFFGVTVFFESYGQRFEVWVKTSGSNTKVKGNFRFSNDSILMVYSNASLLFPSKEKCFRWDEVTTLEIRNKSKHLTGQLIGMGVGLTASLIVNSSLKKSFDDKNIGMAFVIPLVTGGLTGVGILAGHLFTFGKIVISLNGKKISEKNHLLRNIIKE